MPKDSCYHSVKARYDVFPSARASQAIAKCRKGKGAVRKTSKGSSLKRWQSEEWTDTKSGKACGAGGSNEYCRPKNKVSSKTPKTVGEISKSKLAQKKAEKSRVGMGRRVTSLSALGELFEFVRLNTAKKTLQRLRARSGRKGKRIIRNNEGINASIADSPMADAPGLERRNTAYVARKDFASKKQPAPTNIGIHEEAHLADHLNTRTAEAITRTQDKNAAKFLADQKAGVSADEALKPVIKSGNKINRVEIKREIRANRRALKEMKAAGASKADIADYTSWAQGQMKEGYRNPYFDDMLNQKGNRSLATAKKVLKENPHLRKVKLSSLEGIFEFERKPPIKYRESSTHPIPNAARGAVLGGGVGLLGAGKLIKSAEGPGPGKFTPSERRAYNSRKRKVRLAGAGIGASIAIPAFIAAGLHNKRKWERKYKHVYDK